MTTMTRTASGLDARVLADLHDAVSALAGQDMDLATERNGVGFNGQDSKFGHRIAALPPVDWTLGQAVEVREMLVKYRKQLLGYGIDEQALPKVEGEKDADARQAARRAVQAKNNGPHIKVSGGVVSVLNSFSVKDALKRVGFRWDGVNKAWFAELNAATAKVLTDLGVDLGDFAGLVAAAAAAPVVQDTRTHITFDAQRDLISVDTPYGTVPLDVIRALPGRVWDGKNKVNTCYPEPAVLDMAAEYGLNVSEEAQQAILGRAEKIKASSAVETDRTDMALADVLRPYQAAGVAYGQEHPHHINADDMGLGKTLQTIAAFETAGEFPVLVTCPASLRGNWVREVAKWTPHRSAAISDGVTIPDTDYVIVSYEAMVKLANS